MGNSKRTDFTGGGSNAPGPGTHNTDAYDTVSRLGKGSTFGPHSTGKLADRSAGMVRNASNPGPGQYNGGNGGLGGPSYSMASRFGKSKDENWQPAPGTYNANLNSVKGDSKASAFGGGQRSNIAKSREGPGPGAYNSTGYRGSDANSYSIGNSMRTKTKN